MALDLLHRRAGRNDHYIPRDGPIMSDGHLYPTLRNFKCLQLLKKFAGAGDRTRACKSEGRRLTDVLLRLR